MVIVLDVDVGAEGTGDDRLLPVAGDPVDERACSCVGAGYRSTDAMEGVRLGKQILSGGPRDSG